MQLRLPQRPTDAHKGTFGRVLIIAGSSGMSGAACLSATAALRAGAGLVTVAVPQAIQAIVASFEPSYTTAALPCGDGGLLSGRSVRTAVDLLADRDVVGVGPGLGSSNIVRKLVRGLISEATVPLVLDADALNAVAAEGISLKRDAPTIVTPHPGEFVRLSGRSYEDVAANRQVLAAEYAEQHKVIVVLKGAATIVTDGVETYTNATGNPGMATGGTGDVLTGVIAALCGQGMQPYAAAVAGVYAHGLAGDMVAAATSEQGLIASDLLDWLPHVWSRIEHEAAFSS